MAHGLQIYNSSGFLQIDQLYPQYQVIQSGTAGNNETVYFPSQATVPLVVVRPISSDTCIGRWNAIWTDNFNARTNDTSGNPGGSFFYKVLAPVNTISGPTSGSYGLVLYSSSGSIIFNSQQTNMYRIENVLTFSTEGGANVSNPYNEEIWFSLNGLIFDHVTVIGEGDEWDTHYFWATIQRISETQVYYRPTGGHYRETIFSTVPPFSFDVGGAATIFVGTFTP